MTSVRSLLAICATSGLLVFSRTEASERLSHDIAAQPLAQALSEFAAQTGLQLVYVSEVAATQDSQGAPRGLPAADALQRLLNDTGLRFEFLNERTVRILAGSSCALPSGCAGPPFGAATLAAESSSRSPSPDDPLEEVIVTESRWWLDPTQAVAPLIVLGRRDIERGGASSIGDVLQALPMTTGSPLNTNANGAGASEPRGGGAAGDGSVRILLHDLPTVVLLNGRRLPNSGLGADASVDLNTLPLSFIERVEVLASGASAAFGADAVGGVVNIVTRRSHRGLELSGTRTITERGDGEIVTGQAAIGFDLLGGEWSLGLDYVEQDGVTMERRSYSALPLLTMDSNGPIAPRGRNNLPADGAFMVPERNDLGLEPGIYTRVAGATGQTLADYRPYVRDNDGFNPAPFNYLQTPNERAALWLLGSRPLSGSANFFLEAFVHHRESAQQAAPAAHFASDIPADNYYNPFGFDLPFVNRRLVEAGNRRTEQEVDLWRALVGLEGSVAGWTWELALQSAESEATGVERGFLALSRLASALGPSGLNDSGRVVCGSADPETGRVPAANIIPGCVPLNIFGGAGSVTEEQLAYVMPRALINRGTNEQRYAEFVVSGPGGRMLGRDVQWVLGADYRREAGSLEPDPLYGSEYDTSRFTPTVSGIYDARELFASVQVPLLHDRPWTRDMALNVGMRWSDFDSFDSHTTWQAGLRWQPAEELTLRANYGEVFRAPNLAELYLLPQHVDEGLDVDPWGAREPSLAHLYDVPRRVDEWLDFDPCGNDPTPRQRVNCAADGVPGGAYVQDATDFIVLLGGNPRLKPETGHTLGAGLVYTPVWARGLFASVDYFQANQSNYISVPSPGQILFECAERGTCEGVRRFADGRVSQVAATYRNFRELEVRAFDFAINWSGISLIGEVKSRLLATYLDRWDRQPFAGGEVYSYAGTFDAGARPRWRASGYLDWHSGPWTASYAAEYIGSYSEYVEPWPPFGIEFEPFDRRVDPVLYHDIEAGFKFDSGVTVRAVITNVTDEDPPYLNIAPANTDASTYRLLGRSYFLELRYQVE
jgi:outer membrane receptor protein involved in Fe transport